jgi:thiol-disulfide isomerase/thioredoxin
LERVRYDADNQSTPPMLNGVILHNERNEPLSIGDIITEKKFVYYIPNGSCPPCVEKDLLLLDTLKQKHKEIKIIIFCNSEDIKMFQIFSMQNKRQIPMYNAKVGLEDYGIGQNMRPIYFIINKNLEVTNVFQSNPEIEANHSYFAEILGMFKEESDE